MDEDIVEDPLGFTKQTSLLLAGAGCSQYIKEFQKRNISTDELSYLTEDDVKVLGVSDEDAPMVVKRLQELPKRYVNIFTPQYRFNHAIDIIKNANQWLVVVNDFLIYNRLKLQNCGRDFFLEPNENLKASEALSVAISATLDSIQDFEKELSALDTYVLQADEKTSNRTVKISLLVVGLGTSVYFVVRRFLY